MIFIGKVTASAIGKKSPGFALGTVIFIAAGTAIYEALAASTAKIKRLVMSVVTNELSTANRQPLNKGIRIAKRKGNHPKEKNDLSFRPLVIPISNRNIARNPLNRSLVKGSIPWACFSLAKKPITKLPRISNTLPFVKECLMTVLFSIVVVLSLLKKDIKTSPIIIAGDSIKAIMATM